MENRFSNYLAMIEDEVITEIYDDIVKSGRSDLLNAFSKSFIKPLIRITVIKTMMNVHSKQGIDKQFINDLFGRNIFKE